MDSYYYDIESERFVSIDELKALFFDENENAKEEDFPYYVSCCMAYNNGCLLTLKQRKKELLYLIGENVINEEDKTDYQWMIEEVNAINDLLKN